MQRQDVSPLPIVCCSQSLLNEHWPTMLRFTIRDVLWLTLMVAVLVAWRMDRHRITAAFDESTAKARAEIEVTVKKEKSLRHEIELLGRLAQNRETELQKRD